MLKLLICIVAAITIGVAMLQTRQQHTDLNYQINKLHNQIEGQQAKLWNQQLQIAIAANNASITQSLQASNLNLVPASPEQPNGDGNDHPTLTASAH